MPSMTYGSPEPVVLRASGNARIEPTGSTPTMMQEVLCPVRLIARETPVMVPPVPVPATKTSTLPEEGCAGVEGVEVTASMISGPVVSS